MQRDARCRKWKTENGSERDDATGGASLYISNQVDSRCIAIGGRPPSPTTADAMSAARLNWVPNVVSRCERKCPNILENSSTISISISISICICYFFWPRLGYITQSQIYNSKGYYSVFFNGASNIRQFGTGEP